MNYIIWALVAMLGYTLVAPLMKVALVEVPSTVAVLVSNAILVAAAVVVVAVTESDPLTHLSSPKMLYVVAAGLCLAVGILAYYRALELGPISVVVPIFAMFIVTSSVVGILFLEEVLTLRKGLGIVFGMTAVYLSATG